MNLELPAYIGRYALEWIRGLGRSGIFLVLAVCRGFVVPFRLNRIIKEIEFIGSKSLLIVFVTALFTGMVLGLQGYYSLSQFGAAAALGVMVALSIIRELGPVLCAHYRPGEAKGAPDHPHRGFETVSYVLEGEKRVCVERVDSIHEIAKELGNLYDSGNYRDIISRLTKEIAQWQEKVKDDAAVILKG